jgi:phosphoenolpyruvate carboxykinase (GTP)
MGDYFSHWLAMGEKGGAAMPKIFYVNWFRKSADGRFLWPGYGENSRVLKWIFERCDSRAEARETAVGLLPSLKSFDTIGLKVSQADLETLLSVDVQGWSAEIPSIREHFKSFGDRLPAGLSEELALLEKRLRSAA